MSKKSRNSKIPPRRPIIIRLILFCRSTPAEKACRREKKEAGAHLVSFSNISVARPGDAQVLISLGLI
jgi:hypothetical protein